MNIQINDKYRITSDSRQYMLQERNCIEKGERQGEWTEFSTIGCFGKLDQLLKRFLEISILNSNIASLQELSRQIEDTKLTISEALEKIKESK